MTYYLKNKNPSATKSGPGRFHRQGHKKAKKALTTARNNGRK
jgi:hypothetical protein